METSTKYAVVGTGNIGSALARLFDRAGIGVVIANRRGAESVEKEIDLAASVVQPVSLREALEREVIFIAVPFGAVVELGATLPDWSGKIVVDVTNAYYTPNAAEVLKGRMSSEAVAEMLPGATIVKAFNHLPARTLTSDVADPREKRVLFVSSNSVDASAAVARLADELGFASVELGRIDEGGRLIEVPNTLVLRDFYERPLS